MASDASLPLRRQSSTNLRADDAALTKSLQQLSISHGADAADVPLPGSKSPLLATPSSPWKPSSRHSSPARNPRGLSRSPSSGREPRDREGSQGLLRKASTNSLRSANGAAAGQSSSRRSSYAQGMSPTATKFSPVPPQPIPLPKPPATPASVANECFKAELDMLHGPASNISTQTVVILNDAVYGHRFSRPRTSKNALSTIVERPERIRAGVLGVSLAYVRLGERHCDGAVPLYPKRDLSEIQTVPFRIQKTTRRVSLLSPAVTNVHGMKWMEELKLMCDSAEARLAMGGKELQRPDRPRGDNSTPQKLHEGDLYLCSESLNAIEGALGAVCDAVDIVLGQGPRRAFVGVRPPGHHCSASHPSGFCWVNNVHVGIMHGFLHHDLTHAAIIDFDLHHGDGSQAIAWQHNSRSLLAAKNTAQWKKTSIGYFSLHDINSYPCEGGDEEKVKNASLCIDNAHGQSIWNVHLQSWKTEQDFWDLYESKYSILLEKTRCYLKNQAERLKASGQAPKAVIFFSAGFDASEWESAGMQRHQVNVPTEFYARLSQDVIKLAAEEGLGVDGRVISVLEGGYSDRAICSGTFSHLSGLVSDQKPHLASQSLGGLGVEMSQKIGAVAEETTLIADQSLSSTHAYDAQWWSAAELDRLESHIASPPPCPKKPREPITSTYCSPTQASTAKVSDPVKMRRSLSSLNNQANKPIVRPVSPPPPEVLWTVAAHELSKILIPSDRQTESCKPEDLNAEATRARQARQTSLTGGSMSVPSTPDRSSSRMALRGRKPRAVDFPIGEEELSKNRRQTVATSTVSPDKANRGAPATASKTARRTSRRLSGVSAIVSPTEEMPPPSQPAGDQSSVQPGSSQSAARPDMSGRSQSASSLAMKKARPAAATRKQPPSTPRTPRAAKKVTVPPHSAKAALPSTQSSGPTAASSGRTSADDMEKITSGVKKIKINLITKAKKEAIERSQTSSSASTTGPGELKVYSSDATPIVSPTTEYSTMIPPRSCVTPSDVVSEVGSGSLAATLAPGEPATPISAPLDRGPSPLSASSPTVPQLALATSGDAADVFIPYQPEGPPPMPAGQSEALTWLPPNVSTPPAVTPAATPSPVKKENSLYHHVPGSIPFAPRPQNLAPKVDSVPPKDVTEEKLSEAESPPALWNIPEAPPQ